MRGDENGQQRPVEEETKCVVLDSGRGFHGDSSDSDCHKDEDGSFSAGGELEVRELEQPCGASTTGLQHERIDN